MKKYLLTLFLVLSLSFPVFGADTKITGLTADTTPTTDDLIVTVDSPGASPVNKKVTLGNFAAAIAKLFATTTFGAGSAITWTFDASAGTDATLTFGDNAVTIGGNFFATSIGITGTRIANGFFTDLTVTNAIAGAVTGNAGTATALAADPAGCTGGQVTTDTNASGVSTCTAWAANVLSLLGAADYAAIRALLTDGVYAPVAQTMYLGTTAVAINRGSAALSLAGVSIDGTAGGLVFGSDAQYDIPIRGAGGYGRLATSAGMQSFLGLGITVAGNDVTFPGKVTTTAADGARLWSLPNNTAISPTASSMEVYPEANIWKVNQNGTESSVVIAPTGGQVSISGPTAPRVWTAPDAAITVAYKVASGTSALNTAEIASGDHATVVTTSATGVATTDVINWGFNGDPHGVTGWAPSANGTLTIYAYPSADNVNFLVVNNTGAAITPGAMTLNWWVAR